jgi:hypothetical protein
MIHALFRRLGCPYGELWLPGYLLREVRRLCAPRARGTRHLIFCFVDHYEPHLGKADDATARRRLDAWLERYPRIAARHGDATGHVPGHSFFYPYDEMEPGELRDLASLCASGYGELEIHLHHADDTSAGLREKLRAAIGEWRSVGALGSWPEPAGRPAFGFIHGNWALDNSRLEGSSRNYCGVNDEITLLAEEGCYADFTFPALWQMTQPRQANSLFYAVDDPQRPKSHDRGVPVRVGGQPQGHLMIIQGPLCLARGRGRRLLGQEDGDVTAGKSVRPERIDAWVRTAIHVPGRPEWIFVKVHTHGAADATLESLLGGGFDALFSDLERRFNDGREFRLHYVSARELFNIVKAAEAGHDGDPSQYRDFVIAPPCKADGATGRRGDKGANDRLGVSMCIMPLRPVAPPAFASLRRRK